jgi:hypothetical protein
MFEIRPGEDGKAAMVTVDGAPLAGRFRTVDHVDMPFAAVYVDDEPQYDLEVWTAGNLVHRIPPRGPATEAIYERMARMNPQARDTQSQTTPMTLSGDEAQERREAVRRELSGQRGQLANYEWTALGRMVAVHRKNAGELLSVLNRLGSDVMLAMEMVQNARPRVVGDAVELEIDQRLHNYVASTSSLIDQTRRLVQRYEGTSVAREYERRKDEVIKTSVVAFIRDLRNYAQHRTLPFLGHTMSMNNEEQSFTSEVQLSTAELRAWDKWSAAAREYLDANSDHINLQAAITGHAAIFDRTWTWLFAQYQGIHRTDMAASNELILEYNWYLSGGAEGRPRREWAVIDFPYE